MANYQNEILRLADRQLQPDLKARTLQNFINLQFTYCLWGVVPCSIIFDDSPFNECSHASLAATKALAEKADTGRIT